MKVNSQLKDKLKQNVWDYSVVEQHIDKAHTNLRAMQKMFDM